MPNLKDFCTVKHEHPAIVQPLGTFYKIAEEGKHGRILLIDRIYMVDLNRALPGWKGLTLK